SVANLPAAETGTISTERLTFFGGKARRISRTGSRPGRSSPTTTVRLRHCGVNFSCRIDQVGRERLSQSQGTRRLWRRLFGVITGRTILRSRVVAMVTGVINDNGLLLGFVQCLGVVKMNIGSDFLPEPTDESVYHVLLREGLELQEEASEFIGI